MVSFYHRAIELPYDGQTGLGIRVVTNDVAKADEAITLLSLGIGENGLERLKVCVDVAENREALLSNEYWSENGERLGLITFSRHKCWYICRGRTLLRSDLKPFKPSSCLDRGYHLSPNMRPQM